MVDKIEFCNLKKQYFLLKEKINSCLEKVFEHGQFINGSEVEELEQRLAEYVGVKEAIGVSSGTDALLASLMALNIKRGDFVITTPFTFIASVETIVLLGAQPLFVDIDDKTYNLSAEKLKVFLENPIDSINGGKISQEKIKGIIVVDLFGQPADYDEIHKIAEKYNLFVLEDGAQSFGAEYKGKKACSLGDISITSFFPSKPLGCYGDGGMVFTNNDEIAERIREIRNHGQRRRYNHEILGLNLRLDTLQAAILLAKFDGFANEEISKRCEVAKRYNYFLKDLSGKGVILLYIKYFDKSVYAQYSIQTEKRDELGKFLERRGIPTAVHYPKPLHLQKVFSFLSYGEGDFPVSESVSKKIISLPMDAYKTEDEIRFITDNVKEFIY